jgi:hypothetical protein
MVHLHPLSIAMIKKNPSIGDHKSKLSIYLRSNHILSSVGLPLKFIYITHFIMIDAHLSNNPQLEVKVTLPQKIEKKKKKKTSR